MEELVANGVYYISICAFCFFISFVVKGFIDKFVKEEELLEEYGEEHKEELSGDLSKEELKKHKEEVRKLKAPFELKFSVFVFLALSILLCILFWFHKLSVEFFAYSFLTILLVISFSTDLKICIIPDETNLVGAVVGALYVIYKLIKYPKMGVDLLLGGVIALLIFLAIGGITYLILKKEGMGGGDIKLVFVIGLFLGLKNFVQVFIVSFFVAAVVSVFLLISRIKNRKDYIPFGPFLCIGTYVTMLFPALKTALYLVKLML